MSKAVNRINIIHGDEESRRLLNKYLDSAKSILRELEQSNLDLKELEDKVSKDPTLKLPKSAFKKILKEDLAGEQESVADKNILELEAIRNLVITIQKDR